jgi:hypothetical protein
MTYSNSIGDLYNIIQHRQEKKANKNGEKQEEKKQKIGYFSSRLIKFVRRNKNKLNFVLFIIFLYYQMLLFYYKFETLNCILFTCFIKKQLLLKES